MKIVWIIVVVIFFAVAGYHLNKKSAKRTPGGSDTIVNSTDNTRDSIKADPVIKVNDADAVSSFDTIVRNVPPDAIIAFAETLIGTPYKYGSTDPAVGFDCSGFITYVFSHFNIKVPRSSIDFTNVGKEVPVADSKKGDLILFTGTDSTEKFVGHMGIIVKNENDTVAFIHSSSGKANGVVITPLNDYYKGRFVKVIRYLSNNY